MIDKYYPLPIPFQSIIEGKEIVKCDLKTSIAQKIHLTLITFFQESRYNKEYGCEIWEYDFENIYNINGWKDKVSKSIAETLRENEKRLINQYVTVEIKQEEFSEEQLSPVKTIRKRMDVQVTGSLLKTNEQFHFSEPIYVSPISLD